MILIVVTGQLGGSEVFVRNRPNEPLGSNPNRYPEEIDRYHCHPVIVRGFNVVHPSFKKRFHKIVYLVSFLLYIVFRNHGIMLPVVKVFNYFTEHGTVPEFEFRSVWVPVSRFLRLGAYQYVEFALIDDPKEFILRYFLHGCIVH
jgi:hypothetical protein